MPKQYGRYTEVFISLANHLIDMPYYFPPTNLLFFITISIRVSPAVSIRQTNFYNAYFYSRNDNV